MYPLNVFLRILLTAFAQFAIQCDLVYTRKAKRSTLSSHSILSWWTIMSRYLKHHDVRFGIIYDKHIATTSLLYCQRWNSGWFVAENTYLLCNGKNDRWFPIGLDQIVLKKKICCYLYVHSKTNESKPVKLETDRIVILHIMMSFACQ